MMSQRKSLTLMSFTFIIIMILLLGELSVQGSDVLNEVANYQPSERILGGLYPGIVKVEKHKLESSVILKILEISSQSAFPDLQTTTVEKNSFATNITSAVQKYNLTFIETGLPNGTKWRISLNGLNKSSNSNTISFSEPNGTYNFLVGTVSGFTVNPFAGQQPISGKSSTIRILYTELYPITFKESGLPAGKSWSIAFNGITKSVSGSDSIYLTETNGTYPYTINLPENYTTFPTTGNIYVNGSAVLKNIQFELYTITLTGSVSPTNATMLINGRLVQTVDGVFTLTLAAGQKYEIEVNYPGYNSYYYNMTVTSRTLPTVLINIVLTKAESGLALSLLLTYLAFIIVVSTAVIIALRTIMMRSKRAR